MAKKGLTREQRRLLGRQKKAARKSGGTGLVGFGRPEPGKDLDQRSGSGGAKSGAARRADDKRPG